jgi:cytidylate kinase
VVKKTSSPRRKKEAGIIVAVDGPSGAGKSTVSQQLAQALHGVLLDTGAMYRSVAWYAMQVGAETPEEFGKIARALKFEITGDTHKLLVNGTDPGSELRSQGVSHMASMVSKETSVRKVLTRRQRDLAKRWSRKCPIVVEGRDIGTVVFPYVRFKFFVTADAKTRATRRREQLQKQGLKSPSLKELTKQIEERDARDSTRKVAPLKCAKDAIFVDSTSLDIRQVVKFMMDHIEGALASEGRTLS